MFVSERRYLSLEWCSLQTWNHLDIVWVGLCMQLSKPAKDIEPQTPPYSIILFCSLPNHFGLKAFGSQKVNCHFVFVVDNELLEHLGGPLCPLSFANTNHFSCWPNSPYRSNFIGCPRRNFLVA